RAGQPGRGSSRLRSPGPESVRTFGHVMAYPRLWLLLGLLPLTAAATATVAGIEIGLFIVGLFLFVDVLDRQAALYIAALVISPAVMLCFERGNNDLVAFFLLACALAIIPRSRLFALLLVELAAFLKLYPIVALGWLLRESRRALVLWASAGLAVFALYAAFTRHDIRQILALAPKGVGFNYGPTVLGIWAYDLSGSRPLGDVLFVLSYLVAFVLLVAVLYRTDRDGWIFPTSNPRLIDAFRIGALIYLGTFLQGNTWNYRLVFLIFTVPQLVDWMHAAQPASRRVAGITLGFVLLSAWSPLLGAVEPPAAALLPTFQLLVDELFNWALLACLAYLLIASFPQWIRSEIALFFSKYRRVLRLPA
ncbi:MAG: hypothetical protein ACM3MF_01930, partial [Anaerolineae bacterium]